MNALGRTVSGTVSGKVRRFFKMRLWKNDWSMRSSIFLEVHAKSFIQTAVHRYATRIEHKRDAICKSMRSEKGYK